METLPMAELKYIEKTLGRQAEIARFLGVKPPAVSRWKKGKDQPSEINEERIVALRLVILKLRALFEDDVISEWLLGSNPLLNHNRPIDLIVNGRTTEVFGAIEQTRAGSFA